MIPINASTVAAESESDLISAVNDSAVNYIYLANNITITGGITIPATKTSLVFDGEYPIDSGAKNQFTDVDSSDYNATLGVRSTSSITLTFKNMIINGRNYYGVPYIVESGIYNTNNVSVIYENVSYTGPQITYNHNGLTRYVDCDITIEQTGTSQSQEVGEVNRVELGGRTSILHTSISNDDDYAVFWFRGNTGTMSLTVLEGAQVEITSENCYFMYNMLPVIGSPFPVPYAIREGGSLSLTINKGISYDSRNQISSFLVDTNASFRYIQTANNGTSASLYINGALTVRQGSRFYMQAENSAEPLIRFTSGTGRSLNVDNPLSFVLYCANDPALISAGTTQISLHGGQVNTWSTPRPLAAAGSFEDTPEHKWYKTGYTPPVEFAGSFTQAATSATSNLTQQDPPHPLDSDLHLHSARVISIGDWPIMLNPVEDNGSAIGGWTEPYANMRLIYTVNTVEHTINGTAGGDGRFSIATSGESPPNIPAGTQVAVWSNIPFLIKDTISTVIEAGELSLVSAPDIIVFTLPPISTNPVLLRRTDPEVPVVINDNLTARPQWTLSASISGPLQTESGDVLPDAVVFLETAGGQPVTLNTVPSVVYTGGGAGTLPGSTDVYWNVNEGILVRVTGPIRLGVRYSTRVNWELHASN